MAERLHRGLGLAAVAVLVTGFLGWRSLRATQSGMAVPAAIPNPGLTALMPFVAPAPDSTRILVIAQDSVSLRRDPFEGRSLAQESAPVLSGSAGEAQLPRREAQSWHVTTTLVSGNRRAALINDALIYVGDPLPDGSKLTTVERDHVVVTDQKGAAHTVAVAKEGNG